MEINKFYSDIINGINFHAMGKRTHDTYDIIHVAQFIAAFESSQYYCEKMSKASIFESTAELLTHAMSIRRVDGQILEFGVASGNTINHISKLTNQTVYGFDVFSGLPETWRTGFEKGFFSMENLPQVNKNVELVVGLFHDTLEDFKRKHNEKISLLHVDCDLYSSTKTIFEMLGHLIASGTIIVFDEYFNYPGWKHHEYKAFQEFVVSNNLNYRYDSFVSKHQQVCVIIE